MTSTIPSPTTNVAVNSPALRSENTVSSREKSEARQIVYAIVENKRGVLHRISSMFRAKGFNITSISIGTTFSPDLARMTIVPSGDQAALELLVKQLRKMIDVIEVGTMIRGESIIRELALVKFETKDIGTRHTILELLDKYGAKSADVSNDSLIVELCASPERIDSFLAEASKFGRVNDVVRTGLTALKSGL